MPDLTAKQLELMQHALGYFRESPPGWRNHFCATAGSPDDLAWRGLCDLGLAEAGRPINDGGMNVYHVTEAGKAATWAATPKRVLKGYCIEWDFDESREDRYAETAGKARMEAARSLVEVGCFHESIGEALRGLRVRRIPGATREVAFGG